MSEKIMPTLSQSAKALLDFHRTMIEVDVPFILDGGTLLGFYRDGKFAEDDHDDIDITVGAQFWDKHEKINLGLLDKGFLPYHTWPRNESRHYSGQCAWKRDNVKIDLMFKETKGDKVWWTIYGGKQGITYKAVPAHLLEEAEFMTIAVILDEAHKAELTLGRPAKVEEYLEYRYGDWKTPVHRRDYSCYKTDRCIVEPNNYEAI